MQTDLSTEQIELMIKQSNELIEILTRMQSSSDSKCIIFHYLCILAITFIGGAIGGIARGASDRLNNPRPIPKDYSYSTLTNINRRLSFWLQHIFLGISGSACAIFITLMFSKYLLDIKSLQSITLYSSIAVMGGVMAKRCLPILGERISEEIRQRVKAENKRIESRVDSVEDKVITVEQNLTYRQLIDSADKALSDMNPSLLKKTIENMEKNIAEHGVDRQYIIKLGRLYRRLAEKGIADDFHKFIDRAIDVLRVFVEALRNRGLQNEEVKNAIATAYYNIACYDILKHRNTTGYDKTIYLNDARKSLKIALRIASYMKPYAKEDPDLKEIWDQVK